MSMREKTQADFDLEKLFELMDEALTSKDERVQSALRGLLTIIELTRVQDDNKHAIETSHGPLRQMQEDLKHISRRLNNLQEEVRQLKQPPYVPPQPYSPGAGSPYPVGPYVQPGSPYTPIDPKTGSPWWGVDPNGPWTTSKSSSSSSYIPPGPFLTDDDENAKISIKLTK